MINACKCYCHQGGELYHGDRPCCGRPYELFDDQKPAATTEQSSAFADFVFGKPGWAREKGQHIALQMLRGHRDDTSLGIFSSLMSREVWEYGQDHGHDVIRGFLDEVARSGAVPSGWNEALAQSAQRLAAAPEPPQGDALHPRTRDLVNRFAAAMADKLLAAQRKYGYSDGWMRDDWLDECRAKLLEHVAKGDPRDVANYCAFLWHHGAITAGADTPRSGDAPVAYEYRHKSLPNADGETVWLPWQRFGPHMQIRPVDPPADAREGEQDERDREVGRKWRENSSLEEWFPLTAEQLARDAEDARRYRWITNRPYSTVSIQSHWGQPDFSAASCDLNAAIDSAMGAGGGK